MNSLIPDVTLQHGPLWFLPQPEIENPEQIPMTNRGWFMSNFIYGQICFSLAYSQFGKS